MPKIFVKKPFRFAVDGNHVIDVEDGEQEVTERCAKVALKEGWANAVKQGENTGNPTKPPVDKKAAQAAPQNKAQMKTPKNKEK
jgi:hypothetical protein